MKGTGLRMISKILVFADEKISWKVFQIQKQALQRLLKLIGPIYIAHYLNINMVHIITR